MNIPVIFEDDTILVINKPSGLVVHPYDFSTEETLLDFLHVHSPEMFLVENNITLQDGRTIALGGIVHKLDRETSGVMVVAKNEEAFKELREQFIDHRVEKVYVAMVEGAVEQDVFTIDAPLGRNKKEYKQKVNPENPRRELREAVTDVRVITRHDTTTLVELKPKTGRTHQLRAHMAYIGHPIVGDIAYGSTVKDSRIMLHAKSLTCILQGRQKTFEAIPPEIFV